MMMMVMMMRRMSHTERWSCFPKVKSLVTKVLLKILQVLLKILPVPNNQASWSNTMIIIIIPVCRLLLGWPLFKWL